MVHKKSKSKDFLVSRRKNDEIPRSDVTQELLSNDAAEESKTNISEVSFQNDFIEESKTNISEDLSLNDAVQESKPNIFEALSRNNAVEESRTNISGDHLNNVVKESKPNIMSDDFFLIDAVEESKTNISEELLQNDAAEQSNTNTSDDYSWPPPYPYHDHDYYGLINPLRHFEGYGDLFQKHERVCGAHSNTSLIHDAVTTVKDLSHSPPLLLHSNDLNESGLVFAVSEEEKENAPLVALNTSEALDTAMDPLLMSPSLTDDVSSTNMEVQLMRIVAENVQQYCPYRWICKNYNNVLEVSLFSEGFPRMTQRVIGVNCRGSVSLSVHGKILHFHRKIFPMLPKVPFLEPSSIENFVDSIVTILNIVKTFQICVGSNLGSQSQYWKFMSDCLVDENQFRESRYDQCCRSEKCSYLVPQSSLRCSGCAALHRTICRRLQRSGNSIFLPPKKSKPDKTLTPSEVQWRVKDQSREIRHLRRQIQRLKENINRCKSKSSQDQKSKVK